MQGFVRENMFTTRVLKYLLRFTKRAVITARIENIYTQVTVLGKGHYYFLFPDEWLLSPANNLFMFFPQLLPRFLRGVL